MRNNWFSGDDDESRDGDDSLGDELISDRTKGELRILVSKLKDRCLESESKLKN
jgi:hypothetical protein